MDKINAVNTTTSNVDKIKQLVTEYDFDKFDTDGDGKLNDTEVSKLKRVFNTIDFDVDEEGCLDESAFNTALKNYK